MTNITFSASDPEISVTAKLLGIPQPPVPRPRFDTQERPGRRDAVQYLSHEAYEMTLQVKLDNPDRVSVEGKITRLQSLAQRHHFAGVFEPPIVKIACPAVPLTNLRWRVAEITEDINRTRFQYKVAGDKQLDRHLYVANVRLLERTFDEVLVEQLRAVLPADHSRGITRRTTTVRAGEDSLYDVARRVYRDPSRAAQIQRANPIIVRWLGQRLKVGTKLRLPA